MEEEDAIRRICRCCYQHKIVLSSERTHREEILSLTDIQYSRSKEQILLKSFVVTLFCECSCTERVRGLSLQEEIR